MLTNHGPGKGTAAVHWHGDNYDGSRVAVFSHWRHVLGGPPGKLAYGVSTV